MLANYRCNEIKNSVLLSFEPQLNEFSTAAENKLMTTFKKSCLELIDQITGKIRRNNKPK